MRVMRVSRGRVAAVVAMAVAVFLLGGVAYSLVLHPTVNPPNPSDIFYACKSTAGTVRPATIRLNTLPTSCPTKGDVIIAWTGTGARGAQGAAGAQGVQGPPGAQGPVATHNPFADLQKRLEQKNKG